MTKKSTNDRRRSWAEHPNICGERGCRPFRTRTGTEHLCVRGDQGQCRDVRLKCAGTPPRAWRSVQLDRGVGLTDRNTSTCVEIRPWRRPRPRGRPEHLHVRGDQGSGARGGTCRTEHLHVCGDQPGVDDLPVVPAGTLPRAWRSARREPAGGSLRRNTSTCVEISGLSPTRGCATAEHLHVRGDQLDGVAGEADAVGTPPRAWRSERRR